jgi:hypothetical protein
VHPRAPIGRFAVEFLGNRARRAQQPLEPSDIDREEIVAVPLVTR